jgi:hypothetical protein
MSKAAVDVGLPHHPTAQRQTVPRRIYVPAAVVAAALAMLGFWRTYFGPLMAGTVHQPPIIHIHTAVMVTWLVLFLGQVWFAASGRIRLHIHVGPWVMGYGIIVVILGLLATSAGFSARLSTGDVLRAQRWVFGPLRDLVFFVPFLALGWVYRRRPEVHKRVMLVATTILVMPAIGRMAFLGFPVPVWKYMLIWPWPVYLAMVHDVRTGKRVHRVYVIGIAAMLAMRLVLPLNQSAAWHAVAAHITAFYQSPTGHGP